MAGAAERAWKGSITWVNVDIFDMSEPSTPGSHCEDLSPFLVDLPDEVAVDIMVVGKRVELSLRVVDSWLSSRESCVRDFHLPAVPELSAEMNEDSDSGYSDSDEEEEDEEVSECETIGAHFGLDSQRQYSNPDLLVSKSFGKMAVDGLAPAAAMEMERGEVEETRVEEVVNTEPQWKVRKMWEVIKRTFLCSGIYSCSKPSDDRENQELGFAAGDGG